MTPYILIKDDQRSQIRGLQDALKAKLEFGKSRKQAHQGMTYTTYGDGPCMWFITHTGRPPRTIADVLFWGIAHTYADACRAAEDRIEAY